MDIDPIAIAKLVREDVNSQRLSEGFAARAGIVAEAYLDGIERRSKGLTHTTKAEDAQYIGQLEVYAVRCLSLLRSQRARYTSNSEAAAQLEVEIRALEKFLNWSERE